MRKASILCVAIAAAAASSAQATLLDLGTAGTFNVYTLGSFTGANSGVQGAAAAGGSFAATNYSVNQNDVDGAGHPGYALAVGGSLSYTNGSIRNGLYYVGGVQTLTGVGLSGATATAAAPFSFADVSAGVRTLSGNLAALNATGSSAIAYGGMTLTGSGGATTVFNLSGSDLSGVSYFNFANLGVHDTLIVNVSGASVTLQGGWNSFADYNVLFNFYEATSLGFNGVGIYGSILAPLASVGPGSGSINGNVIVGNWNSNVALNANHYFVPTDVPGFAVSAPVPEPGTYALMLAGLSVLGCLVRRRKTKIA
jgi:choice-of-anchor A domain-containing protein